MSVPSNRARGFKEVSMQGSILSLGATTILITVLTICAAAVTFLICMFKGFCKERAQKSPFGSVQEKNRNYMMWRGITWIPVSVLEVEKPRGHAKVIPIQSSSLRQTSTLTATPQRLVR